MAIALVVVRTAGRRLQFRNPDEVANASPTGRRGAIKSASQLRVNIDVSRSQVCSRVALARVHSSCFALPGSRFAPARTRLKPRAPTRTFNYPTGVPRLTSCLELQRGYRITGVSVVSTVML